MSVSIDVGVQVSHVVIGLSFEAKDIGAFVSFSNVTVAYSNR